MKSYAKIPRGLITHSQLTIIERMVCMYLICTAGKSGACFPSYNRIADDLHISPGAVGSAIKRLRELDLINRQRRQSKNGGNISNLYIIGQDTYAL